MNHPIKILALLFSLLFCASSKAEMPLTIEELIVQNGEWKLETSFSYLNASTQNTQGFNPIIIQTNETSYVSIPTAIAQVNSNNDVVVATLGIRYGVNTQLEATVRGSYLHMQTRSTNIAENTISKSQEFQDAWLGLNYQFMGDSATQKTSIFADIALHEQGIHTAKHFKSYQIGSSTYYSLDPVVLSISTAWRNNLPRKDGLVIRKPGNSIQISPAIAFAVNDKVTFTTGMQWVLQNASTVDGVVQGLRQTSTDLNLGVGYNLNKRTQLSVNLKANVSGRAGAETRLSLIHTFRR